MISQSGETFHTHRNHILAYYPKEPIIFPHIIIHQLLSPSFHFREKPTRIARLRLKRNVWPSRITCDGGWNGELFLPTRIIIEVVGTEVI